jgi:hypothetical protein
MGAGYGRRRFEPRAPVQSFEIFSDFVGDP